MPGAGGNSLAGAIKGMNEQTAELLAGQLGAMRMIGIESMAIMRQNLDIQNNIQNNTALTAQRILTLVNKFDKYETGAAKIHTVI
jgi:hypothetical protein